MTQLSRTALKALFQTNDVPTQTDFENFIDSIPNFVDNDPSEYLKLSVDFTAVQIASTIKDITIVAALPRTSLITLQGLVLNSYFTGGAIATCTIITYIDGYASTAVASVFSGTSLNLFSNIVSSRQCGVANPALFKIRFTSTGANLDALTAGNLDFYYKLSKITF